MKNYKTLIFDLDDTLIDNTASINYSFKCILKLLNIEYNDYLFLMWMKYDKEYWHIWESGNMYIPKSIQTLEHKITYLRANRFILFFKELNIDLDFDTASKLNEVYCSMLGVNIIEVENASKLLESLTNEYEILIATNGPKEAAYNKLKKAKLNEYITDLISSEDIGFSKPMKEFFDFLFNVSKNKDKNEMLLIGDSLTTDIKGGMDNGIDTCWFNPNNQELKGEYTPTIIIDNLLQLRKRL